MSTIRMKVREGVNTVITDLGHKLEVIEGHIMAPAHLVQTFLTQGFEIVEEAVAKAFGVAPAATQEPAAPEAPAEQPQEEVAAEQPAAEEPAPSADAAAPETPAE